MTAIKEEITKLQKEARTIKKMVSDWQKKKGKNKLNSLDKYSDRWFNSTRK